MRLASGRLLFEGVRCSCWYGLIDVLQRRIYYHATIPKPKMKRKIRQYMQDGIIQGAYPLYAVCGVLRDGSTTL